MEAEARGRGPSHRPPVGSIRVAWRHLVVAFVLTCGGTGAAFGTATIDSFAVTSPASDPRFLINADAVDGNVFSNRYDINANVGVTFPSGGTYRIIFELLDAGNGIIASDVVEVGAMGAGSSVTESGSITVGAADRLDPFALYRVKVSVDQQFVVFGRLVWLEQDSEVEAEGHRYYHFPGTSSGDTAVNVIAELTGVRYSPGPVYILDGSTGRPDLFVPVDFDLYRYDGWGLSKAPLTDIEVTLDWELRRASDDALVPLEDDSLTFTVNDVPGWASGSFGVKLPTVTSAFRMLHVDPVGQLDPINQEYYVQVGISHREVAGVPVVAGNEDRSPDTRVLHFNGTIRFGALSGRIGEFGLEPNVVSAGGLLDIFVAEGAGTLDGFPDHHFGGGGASPIRVWLRSDGDAEMTTGATAVPVDGPDPDVASVAAVGFERSDMTVTGTGASAKVEAFLPAGCGFGESTTDAFLERRVSMGRRSLNTSLRPTGTLVHSPGFPLFVHEESKPVWLETDTIEWTVASGEFRFPGAVPHSIDRPLIEDLEAVVNLLESPGLARKRSNDHAWSAVTAVADAVVSAGPGAEARLDADFTVGSGDFEAHFPYGTFIQWTDPGTISVHGDLIDPATSRLRGVLDPRVRYARHCRDAVDDCGAGEQRTSIRFSPDGRDLRFTELGGLHAPGLVRSGGALAWGYLESDSTNVHRMESSFLWTSFHMAGHFLPEVFDPVTAGRVPAAIHLAGVDPSDLGTFEFPGSDAYRVGGGDYPGLNFRAIGDDGGRQMRSRLGGSDSAPYALKSNSKFYVRDSGVSGIQDTNGGLDPASGQLFGFDVVLDTFGLGWLSNENVISRTDGSVSVPEPAGFTLPFEELRFSCLGAPTTAMPPPAGASGVLDYWNAPFDAFDMAFRTEDPCAPSADNLCLVLGAGMEARHVGLPLYGTLGFSSDGQIVTDRCGVTSEFPLPARFTIEGPRRRGGEVAERYGFTPVRAAYLNHEADDTRPAGPDRVGFWNFAGGLDVAFFEQLAVHMQTGADGGSGPSIIHMTGGWEDASGGSFFDTARFDPGHRGFPDDPGIGDVDEYRASDAHVPHARQRWLGLVDFDYRVRWSSGRRSFHSVAPVSEEFVVLFAEHRVDYLSAEDLHIRFGLEADMDLPDVSLSNLVFNAVDEGLGAAESVVEAVGEEVFAEIEGGIDGFGDLLADRADALLAGPVDQVLTGVVESLFDQLRLLHTDPGASGFDDVAGLVEAYFEVAGGVAPVEGGPAAAGEPPVVPTVETALLNLFGSVDAPVGVVPEIDGRLDAIVSAVGALVADGGEAPSPGLLGRSAGGDRENLATLVEGLVGAFAPDFAGVTAGTAHALLLAEAEPVFGDVVAQLEELRTAILQLRDRLGADVPTVENPFGEDFIDELEELEQRLLDEVRARVLAEAEAAVRAYLESLVAELESIYPDPADVGAYLDGLEEEIKARIRREVRDRLLAGEVVAELQESLRNRLRVAHGVFREAVDTAFAEVNRIIRRLISETVAAVDDTVRAGISTLSQLVKTGRVAGHAHVCGDSLCELRLDALVQLGIPEDDPLEFDGYFRLLRSRSEGPVGCTFPESSNASEAILGARNAPLGWVSSGLRADVEARFGFGQRNGGFVPLGMGGSFELTEGAIGFEAAEITEAAGTVKFGLAEGPGGGLTFGENYVGLHGRVELSGSALEGGLFLGRSCGPDPILMVDPQAGSLLGDLASFTGGYVYGEGWAPIVDFGCAFRVSAGVGAGLFYFAEGPTYGGRMKLAASGEALCAVSIRGDISLVGIKTGDDFRFSGSGRLKGKAGKCPFCVRFNRTVEATYQGGEWDIDY